MRLTPFSLLTGSSFRYSRRLKKNVFGTAPALRASVMSLRPSSRIFPCFSRNGLDFTIVITLLTTSPQPPVPGIRFIVAKPRLFPGAGSAGCGLLERLFLSLLLGTGLRWCLRGRFPGARFCSTTSPEGNTTFTGLRRSARTQRLAQGPKPGPPAATVARQTSRVSPAPPSSLRPGLRHESAPTAASDVTVRGALRGPGCIVRVTAACGGNHGCSQALHFVFKVGNRFQTARFYRDVLGMKVLRHEEFEEGCKAACNGPYDGKWSKTMVGFGPEDDHFVAELTYNYGIGDYKLGNDFMGITLASSQAVSNARKLEWPLTEVAEGVFETEAPGGYKFYLQNRSLPQSDPVLKVTLAVSDLQKSLNYWCNLLGMKIYEKDEEKQRALLGYADNQCKLELQGIKGAVDHAAAFGRIAFSCPQKELPDLEDLMKRENQKILTPLVSLDTPGKATVQVVILADPDGHEICFVGDEAFRELSKMDPEGGKLLDDAMAADKSDEWFAKHNKPKASG
ncbi:LOW QUALITY PROTEIN: glyoxalase domain-containing protein 4 [Symphalangus syndactylus]|uniref:LOW QUALITY PROTEIN: glyoxalase domain-containing protein 4 n=1 Tax=Symphalangus syndactylus TaxID=9590 RepID=UPI0024430553|nr:LOW QUALITY PROTEIN: glyoxalase domain-containing protein 4 [Symphalangus syndactylus]